MNQRLQNLYPFQARFYRAMVFYRRAQWALVLWSLFIVPSSMAATPFLPWPWGLVPLFVQLVMGVAAIVWLHPWLNRRYLRCRRVYRVFIWKSRGLRFSHVRAWKNWPDENTLPDGLWVNVTTPRLVK